MPEFINRRQPVVNSIVNTSVTLEITVTSQFQQPQRLTDVGNNNIWEYELL